MINEKTIENYSKGQLIATSTFEFLSGCSEFDRLKFKTLLEIRAEELGILSEYKKIYKAFQKNNKNKDSTDKTQDNIYNREYILVDKNGKYTISVPLLAEYIKKNSKYLFCQSDFKASSVQKFIYEQGVFKQVSDNQFKGYIKNHIPLELQHPKLVNDTFQLLICDTQECIQVEALNSNENIINFKNGILKLDTMSLVPHSPNYLSTIQIPYQYNTNALKPENSVFEKFLSHLCYDDPERIQFLKQYIGVALSNIFAYRMKKALFMVGDSDTGKSQCKELINRILGKDYFSSIELSEIEERFGTISLYGKRLGGSSDLKSTYINELAKFKNLTGGDYVHAEYKGENGIDFKYKGLLWFCMNELPKFGGDHSDAVYERILILECNNPVPYKDPFLLDKMMLEKEYIISECVKAAKKVIENGYLFDVPKCCSSLKARFIVENDSVFKFVEECTEAKCDEKYTNTPTTGKIYNAYKEWCKDNIRKGQAETLQTFRKRLYEIGYGEVARSMGNSYYKLFKLTSEAENTLLNASNE